MSIGQLGKKEKIAGDRMILDFLKLSLNNLRRRKLRSWLTMLGIFIGIAAVVALISLGQGLQAAINEQFQQLGSDKIIIQSKTMGPPGSATSKSIILTDKDLKIIENVRGVKWAIGILMKSGQVVSKRESNIVFEIGINPSDLKLLKEIQSFEIIDGRDLKEGDKYKAVVGYNHIYGDLWNKPISIGSAIEIDRIEFKVVGVIKKVGNPYDDSAVYVSKDILREILDAGNEESEIIVKTAERFEPSSVADAIKRKLRQLRNEKEGQETFSVQTSDQLLQTFSTIFGIVQAVLVGIAAISLLVGGIGIMNTMYTSVLERTKEIGTMKAVGAKNSDILLIFLMESGLLGLVGGAIGVAIGFGLGKSTEYIAGVYLGSSLLRAVFPWYLILGALMFSFVIGSLSGALPAIQASKLKPVDALRYE
ncbi:ABC transporter permease [Candidatus Woesearchaeota archaeon CG10_big_fil_rev_8_21_14_0_10_34_12]|nr:MAG: ABC transporter permease [Candidatus Woesearchaeota archaeon CG10_big_fil_rev_8_21_14_0_10_34_12]